MCPVSGLPAIATTNSGRESGLARLAVSQTAYNCGGARVLSKGTGSLSSGCVARDFVDPDGDCGVTTALLFIVERGFVRFSYLLGMVI